MKYCPKCKATKELAEFSRGQSWCKLCKRQADNHSYSTNACRRQGIRASATQARKDRVAWIQDYKRSHGCTDCGETDPIVLDFDHLRDKVIEVSTMAGRGMTIERIEKEIEKCEVVCANCHRRRTHSRR